MMDELNIEARAASEPLPFATPVQGQAVLSATTTFLLSAPEPFFCCGSGGGSLLQSFTSLGEVVREIRVEFEGESTTINELFIDRPYTRKVPELLSLALRLFFT